VVIPADHGHGSREAALEDGNLIRTLPTIDLTAAEMLAIRELLENAFASDDETFSAADWEHTLHGVHALAEIDGRIVAHRHDNGAYYECNSGGCSRL
jgi:hypothetical protein